MTTKRSLAGSAVCTVLALALAGCGAQPFPTSATRPAGVPVTTPAATPATLQARLLASVQRATAAQTARIALNMSASDGQGDDTTMSGTGVIDMTAMKMDFNLQEDSGDGPDSAELRIVGRTAYLDTNGTWTATPLGVGPSTTAVPDPTSYLDFLQGISSDVRVEGREVVRGDETTRYGATIDLGRALAGKTANATQRGLVQSVLSLLGNLHMPVTVWVDDAGRLRKLQLTMDLGSVAGTGLTPDVAPKVEVSMEFYDFGVPVHVDVPTGAVSPVAIAEYRATQADLRNALTAEKTIYTDNEQYSADPATMKQIEPTLDWGGKLSVVVGEPGAAGQVVCLAERSKAGPMFALADVASGTYAGTFYGKAGCPAVVTAARVSTLGSRW